MPQAFQAYLNNLNNYVWPPTDATAEFESLCVHASTYYKDSHDAVKPPPEQRKLVIAAMIERFSCVRSSQPPEWCGYDNFCRVVRDLDFSSSPGYPYLRTAPTIREWLGFNGVTFNQERLDILWAEVKEILHDAREEKEDFEVLWRCFIKQEPHKKSKAENKRWRLIMCAPLALQVVWQMVTSKMNNKIIERAYDLPTQQGMVLPFGGWKLFYQQWKSKRLSCSMDMSAWDWTYPSWLFDDVREFRHQMTDADELWHKTLDYLYANAFGRCKVILSDGRIFQQLYPGIMKSGVVSTISDNGIGGYALHCHVAIDMDVKDMETAVFVGDDKLASEEFMNSKEAIEKYGVRLKTITPTIEFVGNEWSESGIRPMYIGKHVFNLLHSSEDNVVDMLDSYLRLHSHSDFRLFLRWIIKRMGWQDSFYSDWYYRFWMDSPSAVLLADMIDITRYD